MTFSKETLTLHAAINRVALELFAIGIEFPLTINISKENLALLSKAYAPAERGSDVEGAGLTGIVTHPGTIHFKIV